MSATSTPRPGPLTDVSAMPVIHTVYRRELRLAGGLVRAVAYGDTVRARVVADHLQWVGEHLHRHHTLEDRMLWPLLLGRVAAELEPVVALMQTQHATVDALQEQVAEVLPRWRDAAREEDGQQLAQLLDRLYVHLVEHLDAEEQRLLPIAARALTQAEWDAMGRAARDETPRREQALTLGMYLYEGDPEAVAAMLASAPRPVRAMLTRAARRAFARQALRVHGTATP